MARRNNNNTKVRANNGGGVNGNTSGISINTNNSTIDSSYVNSTLSENAGKINYSYLPGSRIFKDLLDVDYSNFNGMISLPGVMTFPMYMTIGNQDNLATDPINLAAQKIYTKVRSVNAGAKNYDQNNLMIHIMAMESIYAFHAFLLRIAGLTWSYSSSNYYVPNVIAEALNIDIQDFIANSAQFERYINLYAARTSSIVIPDVIPMLTDSSRLINRVFMDEDSVIGQMYLFKPMGFYKYEENVNSGEAFGTLQWLPLYDESVPTPKLTYRDMVEYGDALLNDLLNSEDMALMSGDIKKAYPDSALLTIPMVNDFKLEFVYDTDVLTAIQNAQFVPDSLDIQVGAIAAVPENNNLSQDITLVRNATPQGYVDKININKKSFINQNTHAPELKDNYNAIKFKSLVSIEDSVPTLDVYGLIILSTPYVTGFNWNNGNLTITNYPFFQNVALSAETGAVATSAATLNIELVAGASFNMHPFLYAGVAQIIETPDDKVLPMVKACYPIGNIYQPTVINSEVIAAMNRAYLMSEFGV